MSSMIFNNIDKLFTQTKGSNHKVRTRYLSSKHTITVVSF